MSLPLSKTLDPADFDQLAEELAVVDQHFTRDREQHPLRKWEYSLALRAFNTWRATRDPNDDPYVYDVGGAGSPFRYMVPNTVRVIDPDATPSYTLAQYVQEHPRLASCVFCLSVLEHVDDLDRFLYHLGCLVAPGGLLFLTCDFTDDDPYPQVLSDTKHFHWMRQRIFNEHTLTGDVIEPLLDRDFTWLGERDLRYCGDHVYDYTFASLALVKRA